MMSIEANETASQALGIAGIAPDKVGRLALAGLDRTLAVLAHAGIGLGLVGVGLLASLVITGVIWLRSRHSPVLHRESEQAGWFQLTVFVASLLAIGVWTLALVWVIGQMPGGRIDGPALWVAVGAIALAVPLFAVWYFGTIAYGIVVAVRVAAGRPGWYPIIGDWVDRRIARAELGQKAKLAGRGAG